MNLYQKYSQRLPYQFAVKSSTENYDSPSFPMTEAEFIDAKEVDGDYVIVEVNDKQSIYAGYEDLRDKNLYEKVIAYLSE